MWFKPTFCFDTFANIHSLYFHWPASLVPLKCPRQAILHLTVCTYNSKMTPCLSSALCQFITIFASFPLCLFSVFTLLMCSAWSLNPDPVWVNSQVPKQCMASICVRLSHWVFPYTIDYVWLCCFGSSIVFSCLCLSLFSILACHHLWLNSASFGVRFHLWSQLHLVVKPLPLVV